MSKHTDRSHFLCHYRFDPERFSEENVKSRSHYAFEPFGFAGKRKCPGYKLAILEALTILSSLVQAFRIELVPGQVVAPQYGLVTMPKEEIWITVTER